MWFSFSLKQFLLFIISKWKWNLKLAFKYFKYSSDNDNFSAI